MTRSLDVPDPSPLDARIAARLEVVTRERDAYGAAITEMLRAVQEARHERDDARRALCSLLDALGSSREAAAVAEAMETRRGWGL